MAEKKICPICNKRRGERYCPALGEKICAIDCGTGREVTIDCPGDCPYLIAAHRWEEAHPKPLAENEIPFPDVAFPADLIHTRRQTLSGLGQAVLEYARQQASLNDSDVLAAVQAMAETQRTLLSGIYYEKLPGGVLAAGLYAALATFVAEEKKRDAEHRESAALRDSEIFHLLVFFARFGRLRRMAARAHAPFSIFCARNSRPNRAWPEKRHASLSLSCTSRLSSTTRSGVRIET